jgi:propane monooxygenase coupling protein
MTTATLTDPNKAFRQDNTASNQCGITLMNTQDGYTIARVMATKKDVKIRELPSMIRVDGIKKIDFDLAELSAAVGRELYPADIEEVMSTHYGRMVVTDDHVYLFANPEDAAEYIDFGLKPVK